ncbi:hypothetical protein R1sor_023171 [Riccia sorocarpa]|uniref:Uncharacterized protein n=1 Tax=Riccia sorocarpa TaxID=122646 RepID=A0ABD3GQ85_9MARC
MCSISPDVSSSDKEERPVLRHQKSKVQFSSETSGPPRRQQSQDQLSNEAVFPPSRQQSIASSTVVFPPSRQQSIASSTVTDGEHIVEVLRDPPPSSEEDFQASSLGPEWRREGRYIDASCLFDSIRTSPNHVYEKDDPEDTYDEDGPGGNLGGEEEKKSKKKEKAPEQHITIFALRLALIEKGASGLGALSFLWATVVILGGFATSVNETDFWVVTLIILAESSRIFSRSHELEWQRLSVRSHEGIAHRFLTSVTLARDLTTRIKSFLHFQTEITDGGTSPTGAGGAQLSPPGSVSSPSLQNPKGTRPPAPVRRMNIVDSKTKDQTRTWNAPSLQIVPFTHHLATTKLVSRLLYAVQLLSAMMSIALAIWRLQQQDFFYNPNGNQQKPPNITVSMNVFYILSVVEAGMFLAEKSYWEYKIRVKELLQSVNKEAELGPENLVTVKQFFYDVYSQCLRGSVFDGLEMDLVSFSTSWLQAEDFKQQLGGARLLNRIVSGPDGKPRKDHFAADCLRRMGTSPGIIERLVEMLSWSSKHEQPLLSEVSTVICRLVVYNRNCSRIVAIPGSIEGITNLLLPHKWPTSKASEQFLEQTKTYLELSLNGLRILKYLCKDHKNCLRIGEAKGLLSILIFFIEVRNEKAFEHSTSSGKDPEHGRDILYYYLKRYKKSLQVIGLLAANTNTSGGTLRSRIAAVVSGLKNLRDMIHYGRSQPELQRLSVEILFHLAIDLDVRKTIGATGGIIRSLYDLFASYDEAASGKTSCNPSTTSEKSNFTKERQERRLVSQTAGKTLSRIVLQNEKNCLKLVYVNSKNGEPFLKCMTEFLSKPLKKAAGTANEEIASCSTQILKEAADDANEEIASCTAQILRSVIHHVDDKLKRQVAEGSAHIVLQLIQQRLQKKRSLLYESYLGLASKIVEHLNLETYSLLIHKVIKQDELAVLILKNLRHTPSTNRFPNIRRFGSLVQVLHDTLDSISEVENFCLFSGLVGYVKHLEEMETLVNRAIEKVETVDLAANP